MGLMVAIALGVAELALPPAVRAIVLARVRGCRRQAPYTDNRAQDRR
jgi:hypothetical protein